MLSPSTTRVVSASVALSLLAACTTPPDKVSASYVSPMQYADYSCAQIKGELQRVNRKVVSVSGAQKKEADKDAVAMGVGLVLFWPALFFLVGDDQKEELARLKGEYDALQEAAVKKECELELAR